MRVNAGVTFSAIAGLLLVGALGIAGDRASALASDTGAGYAAPSLSAMAALGQKIFADPLLSASGRQSCESCHDPKTAYAPNNDRSVGRA